MQAQYTTWRKVHRECCRGQAWFQTHQREGVVTFAVYVIHSAVASHDRNQPLLTRPALLQFDAGRFDAVGDTEAVAPKPRRHLPLQVGGPHRRSNDEAADELAYYRRLQPIQVASSQRQSEMRERLLPDIHRQLANLRGNLDVVQTKLAGLVIRAPVEGVVTALDLKVGEHRSPGERLAEVTPEAGMKLAADVDEYYLSRVRAGQWATVELEGTTLKASVRRVSPQVRNGQFSIDLDFDGGSPTNLVSGETAQGRLQLGGDSDALLVPVGAFLERTGGNWIFVVAPDGRSAVRRDLKVGRRTTEQLEILGGLTAGERVITSDYTGLDRADRILLNP